MPTEIIEVDQNKIDEIDRLMKSIYRLIIFSRNHFDDDLLDNFLEGMHNFTELVGIKNAQMEAQDEEETKKYLKNLKNALSIVVDEISVGNNFHKELQLFHLLRLISPETNNVHPNRYRQTFVQIGNHICPSPTLIPNLISELFFRTMSVQNTVIRAIYFHHELIRIHPFVDGNGRVTRIAKNWMLMHDLYPPIFINDSRQKKEYIATLGSSFTELENHPEKWNVFSAMFFEQELERLRINAFLLYENINRIGIKRERLRNNVKDNKL